MEQKQRHSGPELTQLCHRLDIGTELKRNTNGYGLQLAGDGRSGNSRAMMEMGDLG